VKVGSGKYTYELVEGWGQLPAGWEWGQVGGVAVDSQDQAHVFTRTAHPLMVFDREGAFLRSWGEGVFEDAHGINIGPDDSIYLVDRSPQVAMKFTHDGQLLFTMGNRGQPSDTGYTEENRTVLHAGPPFHHPTDAALSSQREIYISDGYRNCRVHKFSPEGKLLFSWGEPGDGPGQRPSPMLFPQREHPAHYRQRADQRVQKTYHAVNDHEKNIEIFSCAITEIVR